VIRTPKEAPGASQRGVPVAVLDRFRLFEKTLLPLALMATLFAATIALGGVVLHRTVAGYRDILSHNAPAVLRLERLNVATDQVGYALERNVDYRCLGKDVAICAETQRALDAAAAEGEQRLDEAVRFDPAYRTDYDRFRQSFRAVVQLTRSAMDLSMKDDKASALTITPQVNARILALSDELFRYSSQRSQANRAQGLALAATASMTERNMILLGVLAAILGLGIAAWIGLAEMTVPVLRLCASMAQLAAGKLDVTVEGQDRQDEIGKMARAVQVFKENAHARRLAEAEAEAARNAAAQARREAEAELARVARVLSLGELASSITHEINQPIAAISTSGQSALGWLRRTPPDLDRAGAAVERTVRDAQRAAAIVARVRGMIANHEPEHAPLDVNEVIREVLGFIEDERRRALVVIRTELDPNLPCVTGDPIQLQQVVLNLVMNGIDAVRASPSQDRLLLIRSSVTEPGVVKIAVEDRGSGLDPELTERVFAPLFTTKKTGIGLGLSITRSIIESHGGRIWAEPATPKGALFQFTLPVASGDMHMCASPSEDATA
jgi:C4-dicarboxylate-specific signal transduction histidine kinase